MRAKIFVATPIAIAAVSLVVTAGLGKPAIKQEPAPQSAPDTPEHLYSQDPEHLWNRLDRWLRIRVNSDGTAFGADAVDPLLWRDTQYLLAGASHTTALTLLDEFLNTDADRLVADPVRRALFQHDLWAVFDWTVSHFESNAAARHALGTRLARVIRRLALTPEEMPQLVMAPPAAGPRLDTYASAVKSARYPAQYDPTHRERAFLPPDLFEPAGPWVPIQGNSPLPQHADELSRSWFSVFLSVPGGRGATLAYLKMLWDSTQPFVVDAAASFGGEQRTTISPALRKMPVGTQIALVRKMLLIDATGEIRYSNIVESVQLRVFHAAEPPDARSRLRGTHNDQDFFEFMLDRKGLVADASAGLHAVRPEDEAFLTFSSQGIDPFEHSPVARPGRSLEMCAACHHDEGLASVMTAKRLFKPNTFLTDARRSMDGSAAFWKTQRADWGHLRACWLAEAR